MNTRSTKPTAAQRQGQIEKELREAQRQFNSVGHNNPKHDRLDFNAWLRTVAINQPTLQQGAAFLIDLQDTSAARPTAAQASLQAAQDALTAAIEALQQAHANATATESLVLLPLIRATHDARETANALASARAADADR